MNLSLLLVLFLFAPFSLAQVTEKSLRPLRFVEAKVLNDSDGLPPKIQMIIEVLCQEEVVKVIRHDEVDPKTKKVTIALGALVRENPLSRCTGKKRELSVYAGATFSGQAYELMRIKK